MSVDESLVEALRSARHEAQRITRLESGWCLRNEEAAYETMFEVIRQLEWSQAGWKIAATNPAIQAQLRTDSPVFGPTFREHFLLSPAILDHDRLLSPIVECEFFFRMGKTLSPRNRPYEFDDVVAAVDSVNVGIEIAECRYPDDRLPAKEFIIADGFASGWYVPGVEIPDWQHAFRRNMGVTLFKNGVEKANGFSSDVMGHPLMPVVWLANKLNQMGRGLSEGQVVSSGTCNILARARKGDVFKAVYGDRYEIDVAFV